MSKKSALSETYPTVKVGNKTYTLTPTINAARRIGQAFGGLRSALRKCIDIDIDACVGVIAAGADLTFDSQKELDAFTSELFFNTARDDYESGLSEYLLIMLNGGKRPETDKPKPDEANEPDAGND